MKKKLIYILLLIIVPVCLMAKNNVWKLDDCISIALQNNKDYIIAKKDLMKKEAAKKSAYASLLPALSFNTTYTFLDKDTGDLSALQGKGRHDISFGLGLTYVLPIPFLSDGGYGLARKSYEMAKLNAVIAKDKLEKIKIDTKSIVSKNFYNLLISQKVYELTKSNQKRLQAYRDVALRNFNAGRISNYELLRARVQLLNNTPKLLNSENNVKLAKVSLLQSMGLKLDKPFILKGKIKTEMVKINEKDAVDKALNNRNELKELKLSVKISKLSKKIAKAGRRPILSAFGNLNWDYKKTEIDTGTGQYIGDKSFANNWNIGIQLSIPLSELFPWSKTKKDVKQSEYEISSLIKTQEKTEDLIRLEIRQAVLKLEENQKTIKSQNLAIKLSAEGLRTAKIRYFNGQMGNVELMDAELDYQTAQLSLYQAWNNYINAKIDLNKAMGIY